MLARQQQTAKIQWMPPGVRGRDFIANSTAPINILQGAVRSGKTVPSIMRWAEYVLTAPPGDLAMVGKTLWTLKRNILSPLADWIGSKAFNYQLGAGEGHLLGRKILFYGANDERAESKIRGCTLAGVYGDEITLYPESFWKMMLNRLSVEGAQGFFTTNPDTPKHYLRKDFIENKELLDNGDVRVWHFKLSDNQYLTPAYVERLKRMYSGLWYKRFILGLWAMAEGAIYDMFDQKLHTYSGEPPFTIDHHIVSADYGTSNPCTFGLYGIGRGPAHTGKAVKIKEWRWDSKKRGRQLTDDKYADAYVKFIGNCPVTDHYCDPSAASFIAALNERGIYTSKTDNAVKDGISFMSTLIDQGKYLINTNCPETIDEYEGYVWDSKKVAKGEDEPLKVDDHSPDCDRYGVYSHLNRSGAIVI